MSCDGWGERRRKDRAKVEEGEEKPEGTLVRLRIKKTKRARQGERESAGGGME